MVFNKLKSYNKNITNILNKKTMAIIKPVSARRTVHLSVDELKKLKAKRKLFHTATELSQHLNIGLPTLRRIMELGRGSEPIIDSIKQAIS